MADTKGISVQVSVDLHAKVKAEQEQWELTMSEYIQKVLEEHFTPKSDLKGGNSMNGNNRTLAFQVSEEFFQRVKDYLSKHRGLSQRDFVISLIEAELSSFEAQEAQIREHLGARDGIQQEPLVGAGDGEDPQEGTDGRCDE